MTNDTIDKDATEKPFANTNIRSYVPITLDLEELNFNPWKDLFKACCITFGVHHYLTDPAPTNPSAD